LKKKILESHQIGLYWIIQPLIFSISLRYNRTAGSILGAGFNAFISDWDKISATVSTKSFA
jgi:hypothetical protein